MGPQPGPSTLGPSPAPGVLQQEGQPDTCLGTPHTPGGRAGRGRQGWALPHPCSGSPSSPLYTPHPDGPWGLLPLSPRPVCSLLPQAHPCTHSPKSTASRKPSWADSSRPWSLGLHPGDTTAPTSPSHCVPRGPGPATASQAGKFHLRPYCPSLPVTPQPLRQALNCPAKPTPSALPPLTAARGPCPLSSVPGDTHPHGYLCRT